MFVILTRQFFGNPDINFIKYFWQIDEYIYED